MINGIHHYWKIEVSDLTFDSTEKLIPSLDLVPPIFFEKTFNLGDPRTFANVALLTPRDDSSFHDPFSLSHSLPSLEKFSHYADTVEQLLVREISLWSTSFFVSTLLYRKYAPSFK